jgi:hypothetical protein
MTAFPVAAGVDAGCGILPLGLAMAPATVAVRDGGDPRGKQAASRIIQAIIKRFMG